MTREINKITIDPIASEFVAFVGADPIFLFNEDCELYFESYYDPSFKLRQLFFSIIPLEKYNYLSDEYQFICKINHGKEIKLVYCKTGIKDVL